MGRGVREIECFRFAKATEKLALARRGYDIKRFSSVINVKYRYARVAVSDLDSILSSRVAMGFLFIFYLFIAIQHTFVARKRKIHSCIWSIGLRLKISISRKCNSITRDCNFVTPFSLKCFGMFISDYSFR